MAEPRDGEGRQLPPWDFSCSYMEYEGLELWIGRNGRKGAKPIRNGQNQARGREKINKKKQYREKGKKER